MQQALHSVSSASNGLDLSRIGVELTDWDQRTYLSLISTELSEEQRLRVTVPPQVFPRQTAVIAVHWHPEFVPMDLILERIHATFPNKIEELIIPTQHNVVMSVGDYAGVEIDCHSRGFNRKVQLLVHFRRSKLEKAHVLLSMLSHTFKYRTSQLFEFMDTILEPSMEHRLEKAAQQTGADDTLIGFVRIFTRKLRMLIDRNEAITPPEAIKNKLLSHYFDALRDAYDERLIQHAQVFLKAVKEIVKASFTLEYFYRTSEIIEECRALGAGIVVPHPEQFWPILLADYDVDGYEVWNPQSREYTEFLINAVVRKNRRAAHGERPLMIFMGDDCHMGEKVRDPRHQVPEKASREIGVQLAWDDLAIRKALHLAGVDRASTIREYKSRLA